MLEYPELGMEAVWQIEVEDFPAFIVVDDKGNDFFRISPFQLLHRPDLGNERTTDLRVAWGSRPEQPSRSVWPARPGKSCPDNRAGSQDAQRATRAFAERPVPSIALSRAQRRFRRRAFLTPVGRARGVRPRRPIRTHSMSTSPSSGVRARTPG